MSLSQQEQQALDSIEARLASSDGKLASLLATFNSLCSGEEMPAAEMLRRGKRRGRPVLRRARRRRRHLSRRLRPAPGGARRRLGWERSMLLLWLVVAIALTAVALAVSRGGGGRMCSRSRAMVCAAQALRGADPAASAADAIPALLGAP